MKQTYRAKFPAADLTPHPDNPRRGDVSTIADSIDALGFYGAVLVQASTKRIIAGEHRWLAAQENEQKNLPVLLLDVDDDTAMRIMLADNRTSDRSTYDDQVLVDVLSSLGDLSGTGYSDRDLAALLSSTVPPLPPEDFGLVDVADVETAYKCPSCSFEWSGRPRPVVDS